MSKRYPIGWHASFTRLTFHPEFHLVAGGEELFQENGLLASPKSNSSTESPEPLPPPSLDSPDWRDSWSSTSSVPDFSALNLRSDIVPSSSGPLLSPPVPVPPLAESPVAPTVPLSTSPHSAYATITPAMARAHSRSSVKLEPLLLDPTLFNLPQGSLPETSDYLHAPPPNRLCGMNLWTDSVPLAMIDVDQLTSAPNQPSPPFRILLRFQVRLAPSSINSPAGLQGVQGMMSFASQWTTSAKCHTKSWAGKTRMSHEIGALEQVSPFQQQASTSGSAPSSMVIASLPDSVLTRCSWLDPNVQTITQQIVVDREVLALIIYSVDRTASSVSPPSVELVGFHKYPWHTQPSQPLASPPISPVSPSLFPSAPGAAVAPQTPLFARPLSTGDDVPLSFALDFNRPPTMRAPNATARHPPRPFR